MGKRTWSILLRTKASGSTKKSPMSKKMLRQTRRSEATALSGKGCRKNR